MKQVNNYEEIASLMSEQIKRGVLTNNFLNKTDLELEIKNRTLYYYKYSGGLFLLRDRVTHYILNYYINNINENFENKFLKEVVVELVIRPNDEKIFEVINYFEKHGMNKYLSRVRMNKVNNENVDNPNEDFIKIAEIKDAEEILQILKENFDVYSGCIPTYQILVKDIENQNVYIFKNQKIEGVLQINKGMSSSEIKHLVVIESARRKKIAQKLVQKYFNDVKSNRKNVWTGNDNDIAKMFYKKNGYEEDGYKSIILKG